MAFTTIMLSWTVLPKSVVRFLCSSPSRFSRKDLFEFSTSLPQRGLWKSMSRPPHPAARASVKATETVCERSRDVLSSAPAKQQIHDFFYWLCELTWSCYQGKTANRLSDLSHCVGDVLKPLSQLEHVSGLFSIYRVVMKAMLKLLCE
ncbi:hypothetical protein L1987_15005 [Smallanthus sonchifolius]|uniref:Uncharacterized protein n=1 Tax=Smallanthus sonchifolius TaxID=185202 RepID=A0ACB9J4X0_9ASTR|nr:hypothetical protein L1987_15005 [Smallanthus sonchifolius]